MAARKQFLFAFAVFTGANNFESPSGALKQPLFAFADLSAQTTSVRRKSLPFAPADLLVQKLQFTFLRTQATYVRFC